MATLVTRRSYLVISLCPFRNVFCSQLVISCRAEKHYSRFMLFQFLLESVQFWILHHLNFSSHLFIQVEKESGWQPTMRPTFLWPAPRMTWKTGWRQSEESSGRLLVEVSTYYFGFQQLWNEDVEDVLSPVNPAHIFSSQHCALAPTWTYKLTLCLGQIKLICWKGTFWSAKPILDK